MKKAVTDRCYILLVNLVFLAGCVAPAGKTPESTVSDPMQTTVPSSSTTSSLPTQIPTATLAPLGGAQAIPEGYVYLGDTKTMALGLNFEAGGAIGSLLYRGTEMIDDADYGRYFQFSPYDRDDLLFCHLGLESVTGWFG
jgi:hypothetical protein